MANFEFTAIRGDALSGSALDVGSAFSMPIDAVFTIVISDDDAVLDGDLFRNEIGNDSNQILVNDGAGGGGVRVYAERRLFVEDAAGNRFTMFEIEREGGGDVQSSRFYVFAGNVPDQTTALTVVATTNALGNVALLDQLSGGMSFTPNAAGEIVIEAEDMRLVGYTPVNDSGASGGRDISLIGATGTASLLFGGAPQNYNILIDLIDTPGGTGSVSLRVNGVEITSIDLDFAVNGFSRLTLAAPDVVLARGDLVELVAVADGADLATVDRVVFVQNGAPVATADTVAITEDDTVTFNLLDNDVDPENGPLFLVEVGGIPAGETGLFTTSGGRSARIDIGVLADGEVTIVATGAFDDLAEGETDTLTVEYIVADGDGGVATSTLTVDIAGVNDAPEVTDFTGVTAQDVAFAGQLIAFDIDSPELIFAVNQPTLNGVLAIDVDGTFTYSPNAGFEGADSFTFTVSDGLIAVGGTATITVTAQNDAPVIDVVNSDLAIDLTEAEIEGQGVAIATLTAPAPTWGGGGASGQADADWLRDHVGPGAPNAAIGPVVDFPVSGVILFEDIDAGDDHIAEIVGIATQGDGSPFASIDFSTLLVIDQVDSAAGRIDYTFTADQALIIAADALAEGVTFEIDFTVRVTDNGNPALFDETVLTVSLTGTNDAPVAVPGDFATDEDQLFSDQLVANDIDGDDLAFALADGPTFGDVQVDANGIFTYTPLADFFGTETFTF